MFVVKYLSLYDNFGQESAYPYEDNYLKIHKIKQGPNKGKIQFRFIIPTDNMFYSKKDEENKSSMVLGCVKILDTKYENNSQIRKIELGPVRFRKVAPNTMESVFVEFLIDMGYEADKSTMYAESRYGIFSNLLKELKEKFSNELKVVAENANNLGDVIDNIKNIRQKVFDYLKPHFSEWQLQRSAKQYNL